MAGSDTRTYSFAAVPVVEVRRGPQRVEVVHEERNYIEATLTGDPAAISMIEIFYQGDWLVISSHRPQGVSQVARGDGNIQISGGSNVSVTVNRPGMNFSFSGSTSDATEPVTVNLKVPLGTRIESFGFAGTLVTDE